MKIHRKMLEVATVGDPKIDTMAVHDALFGYAKEVLGDAWRFTPSVDNQNSQLIFTDSSGYEHGWNFVAWGSSGEYISESNRNTGMSEVATRNVAGNFTGVIWESNSGSVGLGLQSDEGKDITWYTLIKFDGLYNDKNLYGVGAISGSNNWGAGKIYVHGNVDISPCNKANTVNIGTGVYLHPLYDPVSGLVSSDIFGVQSTDVDIYGRGGIIVTQGGTSYLSILGSPDIVQPKNILFAKM